MWPRGILNHSKPRNNMVYVSYDIYLINLEFIVIISHHSHMCPSPFFSKFSLPRHDRDGFFNIVWSAHKISILGNDMWIGELLDLNLAEEWPFLSACWYLITFSCWEIQGTNLSPAHPHIQLAFENILHKITQCLVNYCWFAPVVMTGDTAWK